MRIIVPVLALAALPLAACSSEPDAAAPQPRATEQAVPAAASTPDKIADAPPTPSSPPKPGESRTFGDWTVACDNVAICTLASLGAEGGDFPAVTMALTRQPGPGGGWDLSFDAASDNDTVRPTAALVDGRRIALARLDGPPAAALVAAMADGRQLTLVPGDHKLSLRGASAALRWIDAQQGRAGTVTAAVATGRQPASAVPARRAAPVIEALIPSGTAQAPTPAQLAAMRRQAGCDDAVIRNAGIEPETHALGGEATLVLLPCSTGAYNLSSALFVIRGGEVAPAKVDAPTGFGPTPAAGLDRLASVVNGAWKEGELTSDAKGRGLGDCGVSQTLVWDGTRLRLSAQSVMGECRGNPNYLTTFRARVVRR